MSDNKMMTQILKIVNDSLNERLDKQEGQIKELKEALKEYKYMEIVEDIGESRIRKYAELPKRIYTIEDFIKQNVLYNYDLPKYMDKYGSVKVIEVVKWYVDKLNETEEENE